MNKKHNLSPNAEKIAIAAAKWYQRDEPDCKEFDSFDQFNLTHEELMDACRELDDRDIVHIEYDNGDNMYLYVLPGIIDFL